MQFILICAMAGLLHPPDPLFLTNIAPPFVYALCYLPFVGLSWTSHAINLTDELDGLVANCAIPVLLLLSRCDDGVEPGVCRVLRLPASSRE
jgi:UDP-N-acetylmuramyl pentapeptide phosphotransferase/UDP-N-acetylglucosamine-1-phosphate transferase